MLAIWALLSTALLALAAAWLAAAWARRIGAAERARSGLRAVAAVAAGGVSGRATGSAGWSSSGAA